MHAATTHPVQTATASLRRIANCPNVWIDSVYGGGSATPFVMRRAAAATVG